MAFEAPKQGILPIGRKFGKYDVLKLLGRGGMGEVYLLRSSVSGEFYAGKVMLPTSGTPQQIHEWRKRFANEAVFAKKITHKNLTKVYEIGEDPNSHICYIIMDFLSGGSLADKIKSKGRLPVNAAVRIAVKIANALDVAHRAGIVHRDIKPDNILFDDDGEPHLADLGIAKFTSTDGNTTLTKTETIIGTPSYMAPEQMMDSHHVDARADLYSLGIVLYEMLTGVRPRAKSTIMELLAKAVKGEELPDVCEMRPEVSIAVSYVLSRLVAPKPEDRIESAGLAAKLLRLATSGNFKVPREYRRHRERKMTANGKSRLLSAATVAASLIVAAIGVGFGIFAQRAHVPTESKKAQEPPRITDKTIRETKVGDYTWSYWLLNGEAVLSSQDEDGAVMIETPCISPKPTGKLHVPEQLDYYRVGIIGRYAFYGCDGMTAIEMPEWIREIRAGAFVKCSSLTEIKLPDSVTKLENGIFNGCSSLKHINLANCVEISSSNVPFYNLNLLEGISVNEDNPSYTSYAGALYTKYGKTLIAYPAAKTDNAFAYGVETIGRYAFACSKLETLILPESVKKILDYAFFQASFKTIEFPRGLVSMSNAGPINQKNIQFIFHGDAPEPDKSKPESNQITLPETSSAVVFVSRGSKGWNGNRESTSLPARWPIGVPESKSCEIRYIGETAEEAKARRQNEPLLHFAFALGTNWTYRIKGGNAVICSFPMSKSKNCFMSDFNPVGELGIPSALVGYDVTEIDTSALRCCDEITEVNIPNGIKRIGAMAFDQCTKLRKVYIPQSITTIESRPFRLCKSLEEILVNRENPYFMSSGGALYTKDGRLIAYPKTKMDINLLQGTKHLEDGALANASYSSVSVPEGVVSFGRFMFEGCENLKSVELPMSLQEMSDKTFKDCTTLRKVVFHGDAPLHSIDIFINTPADLVVEVPRDANGWTLPSTGKLPAKWPANAGKNARSIRFME